MKRRRHNEQAVRDRIDALFDDSPNGGDEGLEQTLAALKKMAPMSVIQRCVIAPLLEGRLVFELRVVMTEFVLKTGIGSIRQTLAELALDRDRPMDDRALAYFLISNANPHAVDELDRELGSDARAAIDDLEWTDNLLKGMYVAHDWEASLSGVFAGGTDEENQRDLERIEKLRRRAGVPAVCAWGALLCQSDLHASHGMMLNCLTQDIGDDVEIALQRIELNSEVPATRSNAAHFLGHVRERKPTETDQLDVVTWTDDATMTFLVVGWRTPDGSWSFAEIGLLDTSNDLAMVRHRRTREDAERLLAVAQDEWDNEYTPIPVSTALGLAMEALQRNRDEAGLTWLGILGILQRARGSRTGDLPQIDGTWVDTDEVSEMVLDSVLFDFAPGPADLEVAGIAEPNGEPTAAWYDAAVQQLATPQFLADISRRARHYARWLHWQGDGDGAGKWQTLVDEVEAGAERNALVNGLLRASMDDLDAE